MTKHLQNADQQDEAVRTSIEYQNCLVSAGLFKLDTAGRLIKQCTHARARGSYQGGSHQRIGNLSHSFPFFK